MLVGTTNYREVIRDAFHERCSTNPRYSLRAYARDLKMTSARLSEILSGKKGLSRAAANAIAARLRLNERETETFCDLVDSQHARSKTSREAANARLSTLRADHAGRNLEIDAFRAISDWYHFAIVSLVRLKDFKSDTDWIARRLGITVSEAQAALERLERLELIGRENGKYFAAHDYVSSPDGVSSDAIRKFHRQMLEKAQIALALQPVEERDFTALQIPIPSSKLDEARKMIRAFREKFRDTMIVPGECDKVYNLSIQFFNLTQGEVK